MSISFSCLRYSEQHKTKSSLATQFTTHLTVELIMALQSPLENLVCLSVFVCKDTYNFLFPYMAV